MKDFADFLNEGTDLNERSSLDSGQIRDLAKMTKDALGKYSRSQEDDAGEFIGAMGEDISGFGTKEFNAVMKAYKTLKESTEDEDEDDLDEMCEDDV